MEDKKIDLGLLFDEMNKDPFNTTMLTTLQECQGVLARKRHDYGDNNLIDAAALASITCGREIKPYEVCAVLIGLKLARYGYLVDSGKEALHESISDTVQDLINYVVIMERERQKYEHSHKATEPPKGATE